MAVTGIDEYAAVVARHEVRIGAPIGRVWALHTDVNRWTTWQNDIDRAYADGPLQLGSVFHWNTAGLQISSTVYAIEAPRRILWGGPAQGIVGIHEWTFTGDGDATVVTTAESWEGRQVRADTENLRQALDASLISWLRLLRETAEKPAGRS
ncbi:SRPBCC family protein [Micromonospora sp. NPDC000442]|uniref:SRPBCC family protein n=1 Tax=Micromonospora sp. NPDC000442 TaxID=3364217 RepID=UPI0036B833DC